MIRGEDIKLKDHISDRFVNAGLQLFSDPRIVKSYREWLKENDEEDAEFEARQAKYERLHGKESDKDHSSLTKIEVLQMLGSAYGVKTKEKE